ncbi:ion channel [Polaribacter sp.]|nr:ion channel [Polaribacter sp.]
MARKIKDPGFGYNSTKGARNIINPDGSSNVKHENRSSLASDLYSFCINIPWYQFFLLVVALYTILNILFGLLYVSIGIEQITKPKETFIKDFLNGFFFSAQTLTTVGYGGIAPKGIAANFIAAFEAMIGLLSFSFITGLLYGRFSKPKAFIKFSEKLILRDFKNKRAIMFRLMNSRKTIMIAPEVSVTMSTSTRDKTGKFNRNFFKLKLERSKIMYLPTTWTIVHEIDEESPLYEFTNNEIEQLDGFLSVLVNYHEQSFAQGVYQIYSYDFEHLQADVKFTSPTYFDEEGFTILDHDKLGEVEKM